MASTINITRTLRVENESGITGAEAVTVDAVITLDQEISASTEEQTGAVGLYAERMQAIAAVSSQAAEFQLLGTDWAIASITGATPGVVTTALDLTDLLFAGDYVRMRDTTGASNDGIYQVAAVGAGPNEVTLETGHTGVLQAGAGGTISKIMTAQLYAINYELATSGADTFTYAGDLSDVFAAGDIIQMNGTDAAVDDGIWEILTVTTDGPPVTTTTFTIDDLGGGNASTGSAATNGEFQKFRPYIKLAAPAGRPAGRLIPAGRPAGRPAGPNLNGLDDDVARLVIVHPEAGELDETQEEELGKDVIEATTSWLFRISEHQPELV